jgi:hypothetical protein
MEKQRMAILYDQHLPGESLAYILEKELDLDVCLYSVMDPEVMFKLKSAPLDLLMIVEEESPCDKAVLLSAQILETFPSLPLIRIKLAQHILQLYTTQSFPARSPDLIDAIRRTLMEYTGKAGSPENIPRS